MGTKVLQAYTSEYQEPGSGLHSLGGDVYRPLTGEVADALFSVVDEYSSTNYLEDYRVLYVKNVFNKTLSVSSIIIEVSPRYDELLEFGRKGDVAKVQMSIFLPTYGNKNQPHDIIYSDGRFRKSSEISISKFIRENTNNALYGKKVILSNELLSGEYFPFIIQRRVYGPIPFISRFKVDLKFSFSVKEL